MDPDHPNTPERDYYVKSPSKYDIYSETTKPFGESYRRSLHQLFPDDSEQSSLQDTGQLGQDEEKLTEVSNTVNDSMGNILTSGKKEKHEKETLKRAIEESKRNEGNKTEFEVHVTCRVDEIVENQDLEVKNNDEESKDNQTDVQNTTIIEESLTNKTEQIENNNLENDADKQPKLDLRQALMKEIRERRTTCEINKENVENQDCPKKTPNYYGYEKPECSDTFLEEEFSYEPDKNTSSTKVILKSRSMTSIQDNDEVDFKNTLNNTLSGPNKLKITTGPDGTFRYGSRKASMESNILDDDSDITPPSEDFVKNSYVSSLKNAFDAIEDNARKETGKSEAFDGLRHYLQDNRLGLQELLVNNNVVIIEPFREENKRSPFDLSEYNHRNLAGLEGRCRITGATIKSQDDYGKDSTVSNTLPRSTKTQKLLQNRNVFYHPIKTNRELVDSELPDPETVKHAREVFQRVLSSKSTSEIPRPRTKYNTINPRLRITPEVRVIAQSVQRVERKKHGRFIVDVAKEDTRQRFTSQRRWTDTGSLSSGVSSDLSYEHDLELHHEESSNGLESFSSEEDDYQYPDDQDRERHPVSTEVLQKIRACGTSVTYYGGKVIAHSDGPIRSPMTMTIMDEIRRATDERKDQYLGVKFRLVKSNSCGSRLEIAGTEDNDYSSNLRSSHHETFIGKSISEEVCEYNEESLKPADEITEPQEYNKTIIEEDESDDAVEADRYPASEPLQTWADLKLTDTKKQWHCDPDAVSRTQDMEFETFEVLDETVQTKSDGVIGRG